MTTVSDNLGVLDEGRALLDDNGLRPFTVAVRVRTWSGETIGEGDYTDVDTPVTVARGRRPKVVQLKDDNVVAGGEFTRTRFQVQNITPPYDGGGVDPATLDPAPTSSASEVFYVLRGPGLPAGGAKCKKVAGKFDRVFGFSITLETTGEVADEA